MEYMFLVDSVCYVMRMRKSVLVVMGMLSACSSKPEDDAGFKNALYSSALKDPSSAQLQDVSENSHVICGEFNAKNDFRAYTGFKAFVFDRLTGRLLLENSDEVDRNYPGFLSAMEKCDNYTDLFSRKIGRRARELQS